MFKRISIIFFNLFILLSFINSKELNDKEITNLLEKINKFKAETGYSGKPIFDNNIEFYAGNEKVINFNEFGNQFLQNNIDLKWSEILKIHKIINYISNNAKEYSNTKIDLLIFYNNINKLQ
jgi:hypothetical protein